MFRETSAAVQPGVSGGLRHDATAVAGASGPAVAAVAVPEATAEVRSLAGNGGVRGGEEEDNESQSGHPHRDV